MKLTENTWFKITLSTLASVLIALTIATYSIATWKTDIEGQVEQNSVQINKDEHLYRNISEKQEDQAIIYAKISTDLSWIKTKLEELSK